jgi:hypothetical protein
MDINEAPEKLYFGTQGDKGLLDIYSKKESNDEIEYTRTDAFIEKACDFLKSYRQDTYDGTGYIAGIVNDKTIEDFKTFMKGE